jgi:hypothetical protein
MWSTKGKYQKFIYRKMRKPKTGTESNLHRRNIILILFFEIYVRVIPQIGVMTDMEQKKNKNLAFCEFLGHFFCRQRNADFLSFKENLVGKVNFFK